MEHLKVAVLMSTYNGKKYIEEQILSILSQSNIHVQLIIRDDGSTDGTQDIIKRYSYCLENVKFIQGNENLGPGMAFMTLLKNCFSNIYDYYAFADQDDIWHPNKLSKAVEKLMLLDKPVLYCSNQTIYKDGKELGLRFDNTPDLSLIGHISKNALSGCTMVFNSTLAKIIVDKPLPPKKLLQYRMHDAIVFLIALLNGEVIYDENSYINYRIHATNTVGLKKINIFFRTRRFLKHDAKNIRKNSARYLLDYFPVEKKDKEILEEIANYQRSFKERYKLLCDTRFYHESGENKILFWIKILLNYI